MADLPDNVLCFPNISKPAPPVFNPYACVGRLVDALTIMAEQYPEDLVRFAALIRLAGYQVGPLPTYKADTPTSQPSEINWEVVR